MAEAKRKNRRRWASEAMRDVIDERKRQFDRGHTREKDDLLTNHELAAAASCLVTTVASVGRSRTMAPPEFANHIWTAEGWAGLPMPAMWPLDPSLWKPRSARQDLVRAAALCVAEIERLDRAHARNRLQGKG